MKEILKFFKLLCITILASSFVFLSCHSIKIIPPAPVDSFDIGFYNVENLFDTIDTPHKKDEYFTPDGPTKWNSTKYYEKISSLNRVYEAMGSPAILGLCEIENLIVLEDLADSLGINGIIHYESPDVRGIDVGLIYDKKLFTLNSSEFIRINFPDKMFEKYTSRDILHANLKFINGDNYHFFVNHWPSRRGGMKKSSPKREWVSSHLQMKIENVKSNDPNARIIIMGDFNDEPQNKSIKNLESSCLLTNLMSDLKAAGKGSYNYKGNWNMLDQFIVSGNLTEQSIMNGARANNVKIVSEPFMIYKDKKHGDKPSRTYGGPNYYGGISDHYPIKMTVSYK